MTNTLTHYVTITSSITRVRPGWCPVGFQTHVSRGSPSWSSFYGQFLQAPESPKRLAKLRWWWSPARGGHMVGFLPASSGVSKICPAQMVVVLVVLPLGWRRAAVHPRREAAGLSEATAFGGSLRGPRLAFCSFHEWALLNV